MNWFLLRHYSKPTIDFGENRALFAMSTVIPVVAANAYIMAEDSLWFATALAVAGVTSIPHRPNAFEAGLPISGRDIALARLLSALSLSLATLAISVIIVVARGRTDVPIIQYCEAFAIVILGVLLPRLLKPKQFAVTPAAAFPPLLALGGVVVVSRIYLPEAVTLSWLGIGTLAAAVAWWKCVPISYQAAPLAPDSRAANDSRTARPTNTSFWPMVARMLVTGQRLFILPFLLFGGVTRMWWLLIYVGVLMEESWQRSRLLLPLPFSQRQRFWLVIGPGALLPALVMLVGMCFHIPGLQHAENLSRRAPSVYKQESRNFDSPTSISMEYWERAPGGVVPTITAPLGETAQPYIIRVFSAVYYNPFSSRLASSQQFAEWQFRRLTTAVYGFPVELKDYNWEAVQPTRITATTRMQILHATIVLLLFMIYLFMIGIGKIYRFWRHSTFITISAMTVMLLPVAIPLFVTNRYGIKQGATDIVFPLIERALLDFSAMLPSNIAVLLVLAALPIVAMYTLLEWQFRKSEIVAAMSKAGAA